MEPKLFRAAPHLRRCVIYLIVGFVLSLPLMVALAIFVTPNRWVGLVVVYGLVVVLFSSFAPWWRWAVRIDDGGIVRRRLFRWDRWTWDDFASGRIEKRHPMEFIDPQRPWWRRKLTIGMLSNSDLKDVVGRINEHYRLPPPPMCPDVLRLNFALRKSVEFDAGRIRVKKPGGLTEFTWSDVSRLRIVRMDPLRRDFASLQLTFPGEEIELRRGSDSRPFWTGASGEEVNEFLLAHVPPERVVIDIFGECPTQVVDIEELLQQARKSRMEMKGLLWFLALVLVGTLIWADIAEGIGVAIGLAIFEVSVFAPFLWFVYSQGRERREQTAKLESWLASRQSGQG